MGDIRAIVDSDTLAPVHQHLSPAQFGTDRDDWDPGSTDVGKAREIFVSMDASTTVNVSGLSLAGGNVNGDRVVLWNLGGSAITIEYENAASSVTNRILTALQTDISLNNGETIILQYAGTRWNEVGGSYTASESNPGLVELASQSEVEGENNTRVPTASRMLFHPGVSKAWAKFNGTGTVAFYSSWRCSSISDNGTGNYTLNITAVSTANLNVAVISVGRSGFRLYPDLAAAASFSTTGVPVISSNASGTLTDCDVATVAVFGDLA